MGKQVYRDVLSAGGGGGLCLVFTREVLSVGELCLVLTRDVLRGSGELYLVFIIVYRGCPQCRELHLDFI